MMQSILRALKPGGRIVWVEYRAEDPEVPIKPLHKMSEAQVRKEAALLPLQWVKTIEILPRQHVFIFKKI
jgi:predicted methyltransferase